MIMRKFHWIIIALAVIATFASCRKNKDELAILCGHWGCETYISCRTRNDGSEKWDTLRYEVGEGHGYELWFRLDGTGRLRLNDSPAFIKDFSCTYELDQEQQQIVVHGSTWLYALYGSLYLDENEGRFDILTLNDSVLNVEWINEVSESKPFYENFYLRKIIN
jgi:hypothetical protein